jgi:hypothetical protein
MTLGAVRNDLYRAVTAAQPIGTVSRRATCTQCARTSSIGQFAANSTVCIRCKPMPAGWRRGEL